MLAALPVFVVIIRQKARGKRQEEQTMKVWSLGSGVWKYRAVDESQ